MKVDFEKCRGSYPNLSAGFASDDRTRGKQWSACFLDISAGKFLNPVMLRRWWLTMVGQFQSRISVHR